MMFTENYTVHFDSLSQAIELYDLKPLPVQGQAYYAGARYADDGSKVKLFARKHLGGGCVFTFSERSEDAAR